MKTSKRLSGYSRAGGVLVGGAMLALLVASQRPAMAQDDAMAPSANSVSAAAGDPQATTGNVPRLIKFSGVVNGADGKPATGAVTLTFTLYNAQEDGVALWTETQTPQLDSEGHYNVLLGAGSTAGLPLDLFASGTALWLGVQPELPGAGEQPRVLLVAVPYALKAVDADTLGGKPASAYLLSPDLVGSTTNGSAAGGATGSGQRSHSSQPAEAANRNKSNNSPSGVGGGGTLNFIPLWTGSHTLGNSVMFETGGEVGLDTKTPGARLDSFSPAIAVRGTSIGPSGTGVFGNATATSGNTNGVQGQSASTNGVGVFGYSTAISGGGIGLYGLSLGTSGSAVVGNENATSGYTVGVSGNDFSPNGVGVAGGAMATSGSATGVSGSSASMTGSGVSGFATASSGLATGVVGQTFSTGGFGVWGDATAGSGSTIGVYGESESQTGTAVFGNATATSGPTFGVSGAVESPQGVAGIFNSASGQGLILSGHSGSNFAQVFSVDASGNLDISGNLTVAGSKSARVRLQDGRNVALYAVESPENWFEDFGTGELKAGAAEVAFEPEFLQTVDTAIDYHVFLTPNGDCHGLYVASKTARGFTVRELGAGSSTVAFDYRIVAKRRGFEQVRLAEVHVVQGPKDMATRLASARQQQHQALSRTRPPIRPVPEPRVPIPGLPPSAQQAH